MALALAPSKNSQANKRMDNPPGSICRHYIIFEGVWQNNPSARNERYATRTTKAECMMSLEGAAQPFGRRAIQP
jgi:hypothetical protein